MNYLKTIQSRLARKNCKMTQPEIQAVLNDNGIEGEPTVEDITAIVDIIIANKATEETNLGFVNEGDNQLAIVEQETVSFSNKFEKAGALEKVFASNAIAISDAELMAISVEIENDFDNENDFIVSALRQWEDYQAGIIASRVDIVQSTLASIRTNEILADNNIKNSMQATSEFVDNLRNNQRDQFKALAESIKQKRMK